MAITAGKRRENRPVWYGSDISYGENYSVGDWLTFVDPLGTTDCIGVGNRNTIPAGAFSSLCLGSDHTLSGAWGSVAIGTSHNLLGATFSAIAIGWDHFVGGSGNTCIGLNNIINEQVYSSVALGDTLALLGPDSFNDVCIGSTITLNPNSSSIMIGTVLSLGLNSSNGTIIGKQSVIGQSSPNSTILGPDSTIADNSSSAIIVGNVNTIAAGQSSTIVGGYNTVGVNNNSVHAHGSGLAVTDNASVVFVAGYYCTLTSPFATVAIGSAITAQANTSVLLGDNVTTSGGSGGDLVLIGEYVSTNGANSRANNAIGSFVTLGAATLAFGLLENAGPAQFVDNDRITFPDGSGGTIDVELQLTGAFVPTPGMFTADLQLAVTAQDVSNIIAGVALANSTLQDLGGVAKGIGWAHTFGYSTTGAVGNGQLITPTVANGAAAAVGSTFRDGADASPTNNCSVMGDHITLTPNSDRSVMIGNQLTTGTENSYNVIIGGGITLSQADWWSVVLGSINTMGFASPACVLIGRQSSIGEHSYNTIALGTTSTIGDNSPHSLAALGGSVGNTATSAMAMGLFASATGSYAIAFGASAIAGANTMIVGDNANGATAMHLFAVRGYNGGVLDTISAIDNPADGSFGLSIVYNASGTYSNKTIKGAVSPPVGSILLYADP